MQEKLVTSIACRVYSNLASQETEIDFLLFKKELTVTKIVFKEYEGKVLKFYYGQ